MARLNSFGDITPSLLTSNSCHSKQRKAQRSTMLFCPKTT